MSSPDYSSPETPYSYQPLHPKPPQIRLLSLAPTSGPIHCEISTFDLASAPPYKALSYVWGAPTPACSIYINDQPLPVRENLFRFFEAYRDVRKRQPSDRHLWIDQVCINQGDVGERSSQVQMMSDIYTRAESVVVWLGHGDESAYAAAQRFRDQRDTHALSVVLNNPYFSRMWIVQEFLLARRIRILLRDIWVLDENFLRKHDVSKIPALQSISSSARKLLWLRWHRNPTTYDSGPEDLEALLTRFGENECMDARDVVYALQGVIAPEERVVVDYTRSKHQVILDLALVLLVVCFELAEPRDWIHVQQLTWEILCTRMRFTIAQKASLKMLVRELWSMTTMGRFVGMPCPIRDMGFGESEKGVESWWFEFQGKRYWFECEGLERNADTLRLLHEDWDKYTPWSWD